MTAMMKKRGLALLLVVIMIVSILPTFGFTSKAAGTSDVDYVYSGKYIYNWGTRGEVATFLSPNAEKFYTGANTFASLSSYSGGTGKSDAPSSALYKALQNLMKSAHTHQTSYSETKDLYRYTDCQDNGGSVSSFYSGKAIGPSWDGGWNREHTWPNSKGLGGSDENDIMMLRPTCTSENSSRGNTAYGQGGGYYHPNSESGGKYDLRGDTARIFLYVYVRWGNTSYAWGTGGVMESVDVLLEWMEEDPVDTWELGRNESVQSITGTSNVFVDYPELAFLLFGEEIPAGMTTPSGGADANKCDHNNFKVVVVAATCTANGYTQHTCQTAGCGYTYKSDITDAKGHSYVSGTCTACGDVEKQAPTALTELKNGDVVIIGAPAYGMALSTEKVATYYNKGISYENGFDDITDSELFVVTVNSDGTYTFTSKTGDVIAMASDYASLNEEGQHKTWTLEAKSPGVFYVKNVGRGNYLEWYASKNNWSTYTPDQLSDLFEISFYAVSGGGSSSGGNTPGGDNPGGDTTCKHSYSSAVTAPTCTKGGFTTYTCTLCGDSYTGNEVSATGHAYQNGACISCGATKPSESKLTIRFDDVANRTVFTTSQQVWVQNGITVTNDKGAASSNVADYKDPVRFYQSSNVTISCPGMIKIEIDCTGLESKYVGSWLNVQGATATNNNGIITIEFNAPVDSLTYTSLAKQSRAYSITVYLQGSAECDHESTTVKGAVDATCTESGHTGMTCCADCDELLDAGSVIPATGHDGVSHEAKAPTCTEAGWEAYVTCENCNLTTYDEIPALGHADEDGDNTCDRCGKKDEDTTPPSGGEDNPGSGNTGNDDNKPGEDNEGNEDNKPGSGDEGNIDDGSEEETIWDIIMSYIQSIIDSIMEALSGLFDR